MIKKIGHNCPKKVDMLCHSSSNSLHPFWGNSYSFSQNIYKTKYKFEPGGPVHLKGSELSYSGKVERLSSHFQVIFKNIVTFY